MFISDSTACFWLCETSWASISHVAFSSQGFQGGCQLRHVDSGMLKAGVGAETLVRQPASSSLISKCYWSEGIRMSGVLGQGVRGAEQGRLLKSSVIVHSLDCCDNAKRH